MSRFITRYLFVLLPLIVIAVMRTPAFADASAGAAIGGEVDAEILTACKADLAARCKLTVKDIEVALSSAADWDSELGMPQVDTGRTQDKTPGWLINLKAGNTTYLYTASKSAFRYGGPLATWSSSMLYLQPVADELNLNSDLYQCSLMGTNSVRLVAGVEDYYPQPQGVIIYSSRTSRSGHDLCSIKAARDAKPTRLASAFDFGAATLNEAQDKFAAFSRPAVGAGWTVIMGPFGLDAPEVQTLPLPDKFTPGQLAWSGDKLMILGIKSEKTVCYETLASAGGKWKEVAQHTFAGLPDFMLNKSQTLEVVQQTVDGKPSAEVDTVWFTGDRTIVANISGLMLKEYSLLGNGYVFIRGEVDGAVAAYTVSITSGEVILGFLTGGENTSPVTHIKPFQWAPVSTPFQAVKEKGLAG